MPRPAHEPAPGKRRERPAPLALALVVVAGVVGMGSPVTAWAGPPDHNEQVRFMWAMAQRESNADYYARNPHSGAFGKYQIMPFNWPVWAAEYVHDRRADQTPYNQEKVAYRKLSDLYRWLGSWKRVAYWWLTGSSDGNEKRWSSYARNYVTDIMRLRKRAPAGGAAMPPRTSSRPKSGDWRRAGSRLRLRLDVAATAWPHGGKIRDGQVLKVRAVKRARNGVRWIEIVTADGRLGWLRQLSTVPARRPATPSRWADVRHRGVKGEQLDRGMVRPRPR